MKTYHKIQTVYLRDPETRFKTLLDGQYAKPEFEYLANLKWGITEKVDGTNIRIMWNGSKLTFGGKSDNAQIPAPLVERLQDRFNPQEQWFADSFPNGVCLYGEGFGGNIQKKMGMQYSETQDFVLFDILTGDTSVWIERPNVVDIGEALGLQVVPEFSSMTLPEAVQFTKAGFKSVWGDFTAEGVIARPYVEIRDRLGSRVITKIKHKDFSR